MGENSMTATHPEARAILAYLLGEASFDGHWFGEPRPDRGPYWWRDELRKAMVVQPSGDNQMTQEEVLAVFRVAIDAIRNGETPSTRELDQARTAIVALYAREAALREALAYLHDDVNNYFASSNDPDGAVTWPKYFDTSMSAARQALALGEGNVA
jgi:hypothetical protein